MQAPAAKTLKHYGLTEQAWIALLEAQGGICPLCKNVPIRPVIDHEHAPKWRRMKPEKRAKFVRGILCDQCNRRYIRRGMNLERACNVADYLLAYRERSVKLWDEA